jgi:hypothetical protein
MLKLKCDVEDAQAVTLAMEEVVDLVKLVMIGLAFSEFYLFCFFQFFK